MVVVLRVEKKRKENSKLNVKERNTLLFLGKSKKRNEREREKKIWHNAIQIIVHNSFLIPFFFVC